MVLTPVQTLMIISMVTLGTLITRFLPFILFRNKNSHSPFINYLGTVLPFSAIGLLVVYCLKNIKLETPTSAISELIAILCIIILHHRKENTLLSIGFGTAIYMFLVQFIFV